MSFCDLSFKDLLPMINVIIGGLIAFAGSFYGTYILENRRKTIERRVLTLAFFGEMNAIDSIVKKRKYIEHLQKHIAELEETRKYEVFSFPVIRQYFKVYEENAKNIGLIEPCLSMKISMFYTQANAILEDISTLNEVNFDEAEDLIAWHKSLLALFSDTMSLLAGILQEIKTMYQLD